MKAALLDHLFFQLLKRRTRVFDDRAALETRHVAVVAVRFGLVKVLFAIEMHQIEFIDQAQMLKERDGSIDRRTVDVAVLLLGGLQEPGSIEMPGRLLNDADQQAPLGSYAHAAANQLLHQ
jgi:hypothetical protein